MTRRHKLLVARGLALGALATALVAWTCATWSPCAGSMTLTNAVVSGGAAIVLRAGDLHYTVQGVGSRAVADAYRDETGRYRRTMAWTAGWPMAALRATFYETTAPPLVLGASGPRPGGVPPGWTTGLGAAARWCASRLDYGPPQPPRRGPHGLPRPSAPGRPGGAGVRRRHAVLGSRADRARPGVPGGARPPQAPAWRVRGVRV
jgi:hypothetical protein